MCWWCVVFGAGAIMEVSFEPDGGEKYHSAAVAPTYKNVSQENDFYWSVPLSNLR